MCNAGPQRPVLLAKVCLHMGSARRPLLDPIEVEAEWRRGGEREEVVLTPFLHRGQLPVAALSGWLCLCNTSTRVAIE